MGIALFLFTMVIAIAYILLLVKISDGWEACNEWKIPESFTPSDNIAVIIPARNERNNIEMLLNSIVANDYPTSLLEIIVVDDHSSDGTSSYVSHHFPNVKILKCPEGKSGKKEALNYGIEHTDAAIILCTDADCEVRKSWIQSVASYFYYHKVDFTTSLVKTRYRYTILDAFQFVDFAGMMQINAAGIQNKAFYIANGANMAFRKRAFEEIGGFSRNMDIASGDDMFLIQAMADSEKKIGFIKSADSIVTTQPLNTFSTLLKQRKRWAAKTKHYSGRSITKIQSFVFFVHFLIIANLFLIPFTGGLSFFASLFLIFIKWTIDYLFLAKMCRYYKNTKPLKYYFYSATIYFVILFYSAIVALTASKYEWKGRVGT